MMKLNTLVKIVFLIIGAIIPVVFSQSCSHKDAAGKEKPIITVSIMPQKFFVEKIAGDKFYINVMIPPGANHENYDPSPMQIASLAKTTVYFQIGNIEFENTWIARFSDIYPDLKIVNLSQHLSNIENAGDNRHGFYEPHTWMSPVNVSIMADEILRTLTEIDREDSVYFLGNCTHFKTEIDSINKLIHQKLKSPVSRSFIIYHPALTYYAKDFGLKQYPLEIEGKSPSPYVLKGIIELAKKEGIKTIVVQKQFDQSKARVIADEIGGTIITIDPTAYLWTTEIMEITEKLSVSLNHTVR